MSLGYLLVGHGTRNAAGQQQFHQVFRQFSEFVYPAPSGLAFLELAQPEIGIAVHQLASQGVTQLITVPSLLFSAGHAERDIPQAVEAAAAEHSVRVTCQIPALACHPSLLELSAKRFRQAICSSPSPEAGCGQNLTACATACNRRACPEVGLVMVGRGSSSPTATQAMRQFTQLRLEATPVAWHRTAFIHAQQPSVEQALDDLAACDYPLAVVQPHLLFEGELIQQLRSEVQQRQLLQPAKRWVITQTLGADESLARTLAEIALGRARSPHG